MRVHDSEVDVRDPQLGRAALRGGDHAGSDVGRDETPVRPDALRCEEARVPRPRGELEQGLARRGVEESDEPLGELRGSPRRPGRRRSQPAADALPGLDLLVRGRRYVVTCANCGMMSCPYAARASSWPCVIR